MRQGDGKATTEHEPSVIQRRAGGERERERKNRDWRKKDDWKWALRKGEAVFSTFTFTSNHLSPKCCWMSRA